MTSTLPPHSKMTGNCSSCAAFICMQYSSSKEFVAEGQKPFPHKLSFFNFLIGRSYRDHSFLLHLLCTMAWRYDETKHENHFKWFRRKSFCEVLLVSLCSLRVSEECGDFRNVYEVFSRLGWSRQIKCEWFFRSNSLRLAGSCTSSKKCLDKNKHVSVSLSICLESRVFIGNWARFNKKEKLVQAWGRCFTEICSWLLPS